MWEPLDTKPVTALTALAAPALHLTSACLQELPEHTPLVALLGHGEGRGRYSIIGIAKKVHAVAESTRTTTKSLQQLIAERPQNTLRVLLLSYEFGYEQVYLPRHFKAPSTPYALYSDLAAAVIIDQQTRHFKLVGPDLNLRRWFKDLLQTYVRAQATPKPAPLTPLQPATLQSFTPLISDELHQERIWKLKTYLEKGDIYEANLTRRLMLKPRYSQVLQTSAGLNYVLRNLQSHNPVPHGAYLRFGDYSLLSNSMETLLHYNAKTQRASTYPIKGTLPTLHARQSAQITAAQLHQDPKEHAEHIMIVDLLRNDLGRVAKIGSVQIPRLMYSEKYYALYHAISEIQATLAPSYQPGDLLAALFPGGSITGAPKKRAVELIATLENAPRGFYTGALGYVTPRGDLSFSLLIRTMIKERLPSYAEPQWCLGVGGGITLDSDPLKEVEETWHKARIFNDLLVAAEKNL